jgi:NAD/NADP transhydrogenase beta subunit
MGPDELRMASLLGVVADVSSLLGLNLTASSIGGANIPVVITILNS